MPAAEDAEQDVLGAHHGLTEGLCLLAGEANRFTRFAGDEDLRLDRDRLGRFFREVAELAVGSLLADPKRAGDVAPRCTGLERAGNELGLERIELVSQCGKGP